jgi:two-component system NarL family response regulator
MSTERRSRIVVVEDHFLARLAVTHLIENEPDMEIVGRAETGWQALATYRRTRPDLVLMDLRLPEMDGVSATEQIRREDPEARVLILSHYDSEEDVRRAVQVGARGYVKKDVDGATLLEAIRTVARGGRYIPASLAEKLAEQAPSSTLTRRELEVLQLVCTGKSNPEIAALLAVTEGTVRIHVSNILTKMGVKRRGEAVALALKRGLVRTE